jgi:parallel beta-helix repeat protein
MRSFLQLGLAMIAVSTAAPAYAAVLVVDCATGPFFTINGAVGAAANGDTIAVHPCIYNENVVISGFDDLHLVAARRPAGGLVGLTGAMPVGVGVANTSTVIIDGTGLPGAGIHIDNSRDVSVTGFYVRRCASNGIEVLGSFNTVIVNNRLERNVFAGYFEAQVFDGRFAGNYVFRNGQFGVYLEGTQRLTVQDNRIVFNAGDGVLVAGDRIQVVNNDVQSNGQHGIHVRFGNENRVERNTSINNNLSGLGTPNLIVQPGVNLTDVIGNNTAASLVNLGVGTDIAENQ